jgi:hypothetical protein
MFFVVSWADVGPISAVKKISIVVNPSSAKSLFEINTTKHSEIEIIMIMPIANFIRIKH